jgi:hypothetical protein
MDVFSQCNKNRLAALTSPKEVGGSYFVPVPVCGRCSAELIDAILLANTKSEAMACRKLMLQTIGVTLVVLLLVGCGEMRVFPTATPVPPTATRTLEPTLLPSPTRTLMPTATATLTDTPTPILTPTLTPTETPSPVPTPTHTQVGVGVEGDVYSQLNGPAGDLVARNPRTLLGALVQSRNAVQVVVELPSGEIVTLPPFGDLYGSERRSSVGIEGLPQAGGTYTFTVLDIDGVPIPGAVATDIYRGGYEPDPPANVRADVIEAGVLVAWDPSPVIPGAFDPKVSLGFYQIDLHREGMHLYGWNNAGRPLPETSHLIPFHSYDFGPGDRGLGLREMDDGTYSLSLSANTWAPEGTSGHDMECTARDPAEIILIVIEGDQVRVEAP